MIHSASSDNLSLDFEILGRTDGRTDNLCENSGHYIGWDCGRPRGSIFFLPIGKFQNIGHEIDDIKISDSP